MGLFRIRPSIQYLSRIGHFQHLPPQCEIVSFAWVNFFLLTFPLSAKHRGHTNTHRIAPLFISVLAYTALAWFSSTYMSLVMIFHCIRDWSCLYTWERTCRCKPVWAWCVRGRLQWLSTNMPVTIQEPEDDPIYGHATQEWIWPPLRRRQSLCYNHWTWLCNPEDCMFLIWSSHLEWQSNH